MTTLTSRLTAKLQATHTATPPTVDLGASAAATANILAQLDVPLANGTAAGMADLAFSDQRTLAASATEDLDLAGVLTDAFGTTITFAKIKGIYVAAAAANTNDVIVGAASATQWATLLNATGTITLPPGAAFLAAAGVADASGWSVTAGTGDLLKIANSAGGTGVTYDIAIIGTSA